MTRLDDLTIRLNAVDKTANAFKSLGKRTEKLEKAFLKVKIAAAGVGLAATAASAGLVRVFNARAPYLDALSKTADTLGLGVDQLQAFRREAELSGVSVADLDKALLKMNIRIGRAVDGGGAAAKSLKKLGLDAKELAGLNPEEAYIRITNAIGKVPSVAERAAIAMDVFGNKGAQVTRITAENLEKSNKELEDFGIALTRIDGAKIEDANDAVFRVKQNMEGVSNQIAVGMAPAITSVSNFILDMSKSILGANSDLLDFGRTLVRGIGWVGDFVSSFLNGLSFIRITINAAERGISELFVGAIEGIESFLSKIPGGSKLADKLGLDEATSYFKNEIAKTTEDIAELQQGIIDRYQSGTVTAQLEQYFNEAEAAAIIRAREIEARLTPDLSGGAPLNLGAATGANSPVSESQGDDIEAGIGSAFFDQMQQMTEHSAAMRDSVAGSLDWAEEQTKIRAMQMRDSIGSIATALTAGAQAFAAYAESSGESGKKAFKVFKGLQIAAATASAYSAASQALAGFDSATLPERIGKAATALSIGLGYVASISRLTASGGGSGGGAAGASASAGSSSPQSTARGGTLQQETPRAGKVILQMEGRDRTYDDNDIQNIADGLQRLGIDADVVFG